MEHFEIEHKFLIRYPNLDFIMSIDGVTYSSITQLYVNLKNGERIRLRKRVYPDRVEITENQKTKITDIKWIEKEREITEEEYNDYLDNAIKVSNAIVKKRYVIPYNTHKLELDVYPFWEDRAILEIELSDVYERFEIPEYIEVIKEVSSDMRYKNSALAIDIPYDNI